MHVISSSSSVRVSSEQHYDTEASICLGSFLCHKTVCDVIISSIKSRLRSAIPVCPSLCTPVREHNRIPSHTVSRSQIQFLPEAQDDPQRRRPDIRKAKMMLGWEPVVCDTRQTCSQSVLQTYYNNTADLTSYSLMNTKHI